MGILFLASCVVFIACGLASPKTAYAWAALLAAMSVAYAWLVCKNTSLQDFTHWHAYLMAAIGYVWALGSALAGLAASAALAGYGYWRSKLAKDKESGLF